MRVPLVIITEFIDQKTARNSNCLSCEGFLQVSGSTQWSRDTIEVLCSSNSSLLHFDSMRRPKYRQKGILSPFGEVFGYLLQLIDFSSSDFKLINSFTHQCTHRHKFIHLRMNRHICINKWINKCDACSPILTHINTIIWHSLVFFTNETQKTGMAQGHQQTKNLWIFRSGLGGLGKAALSCHFHSSHLWLKVSDQFSTIHKIHQLWPCCVSFGRVQSLIHIFITLSGKVRFPEQLKNTA